MPTWPYNQRELYCYPAVPDHVSLPWDAGDEYLLQLAEQQPTVIFNDRHGAIASSMADDVQPVLDSACALHALRRNWPNTEAPQHLWLEQPNNKLNGFKQALIKFPKSFDALLRYLDWCLQHLTTDHIIHIAGAAKHIPVNWLNWLEQHSEHYQQHRIVRKARAVSLRLNAVPELQTWLGYRTQDNLQLRALPLVFSREREDRGGRALLDKLPPLDGRVLDLGCGNGLLGLSIKQRWPRCQVTLTDDSFSAYLSSKANAERNQLQAECCHGDTCEAVSGPFDTIVCNPPFHDGHKQLTNLAQRMFEQAAQCLASNGQLWVVANRHLPYKPLLQRYFRSITTIGADKFILYHCQP